MKQAKQLSYWAANNPKMAILSLVLLHTLVIFISFKIGKLFFFMDISFPFGLTLSAGIIYCFAAAFYPIFGRKSGWWKHSYIRQKVHDFLLIFSTCLLFLLGYNQFLFSEEVEKNEEFPTQMMNLNKASTEGPSVLSGPFSSMKEMLKGAKYKIRKAGKAAKKRWKQQPERSTGAKVLLTILTVMGMFLTFLVVAMISCSLSCSGNEGAGAVVLVLGLIGIVVGGVFLMIRIWGRRRVKD